MSSYLVGNLSDDAADINRGGWILGSFFPLGGAEAVRHSGALEVKYWHFQPGQEHQHAEKVSSTLEWTYILRGSVTALIAGSPLKMREGDYVIISPETPNNLVHRVHSEVSAITVKAPSDPQAKRVL